MMPAMLRRTISTPLLGDAPALPGGGRAAPAEGSGADAPHDGRPAWRTPLATSGGVLAVIRAVAVPLFFAAERLVDHPVQNTRPFGALLAMAGIYALLCLASELRGRSLASPGALAAIDLLLISALVATSGGPFSQLRYAFFLLPIGAALLLRPRATAVASVAIVVAYATITVTFPNDEAVRNDASGFELTQLLFLGWMGGAATLLSSLLARRAREIADLAAERALLAESRGRLVAQALDAEDLARRRLAEALHDEALQNVLAARHELGAGDHAQLDLVAKGLDQTVVQLREAVFDLRPYLLEQAGLGPALRAVAERAARRGGFEVHVDVEKDAAGPHDQLLFSIGRELIVNAAKHAEASKLWVALRRRDDTVELTVSDDGRGIDAERAALAPRAGHIGLASSRERADAVGGTLHVARGPEGRGTIVRVRLPVPAG
jgi:two-component system NarL family sensor kinase